MNETHDPHARSWHDSANDPETDFPLQNLPFGVFRRKGTNNSGHVGVALGDSIINVSLIDRILPFEGPASQAAQLCRGSILNELMSSGPELQGALRRSLFDLFNETGVNAAQNRRLLEPTLVPITGAEMLMPAAIGDYTDFYASIYHATNVGSMFRPDNPLLPNYKYVPIAYHGRSSSIVISGTPVRRPSGQTMSAEGPPAFEPTRLLDYELEVGIFVGPGNNLGHPISMNEAESHIFGLCLMNDWSARDIQKWEYQPLGPFLAKNFATTISPWIVTLEALEPFRAPAFPRNADDPEPLPYLLSEIDQTSGAIELNLQAYLQSRKMREQKESPLLLGAGNFSDMYWTISQMITHHSSNGCNLSPGDLIGSGTVSGDSEQSRGCLLELTWRGEHPIELPTGESRRFLEDGDEVIIRGFCEREGFRRIGFGECRGTVLPALRNI